MSNERKAIKIIALILGAMGILVLVTLIRDIVAIASGQTIPNAVWYLCTDVVAMVFNFLTCFYGVRGANTPSKVKPFLVFCVAGALFDVFMLLPLFVSFPGLNASLIVGLVIELFDIVIQIMGAVLGKKVYDKALG